MGEPTTNKCYFPSSLTAYWGYFCAVQCFCRNQKPIPVFDHSVARHVVCDLSNILTPFSISLTMLFFDVLNASLRSSVHANFDSGRRSALNGSIFLVLLRVYDAWFTRPNHDRMSVMFLGIGKFMIDRRNLIHGRTSVLVMLKPANSISSAAKTNLDGFNTMPLLP